MTRAFELPDLGEGIHEAEIREVLVSVGDEVEEGETILVVETDKAAVDVPSPFTGSVQEIAVEPGDLVNVGDRLLVFGNGEPEEEAEQAPEEEAVQAPAEQVPEEEAVQTPEEKVPDEEREGPVPASPATRRLARELNVELGEVPGSGPGGRVTSEDVRTYAEEGAPEAPAREAEEEEVAEAPEAEVPEAEAEAPKVEMPAAETPSLPDFSRWGEVERQPLRSVRRTIARRMAQSWSQVPHVNHEDVADVTELERLRREYKEEIEADSLSLTVFVMKAAVSALKAHPRFNASLDVEADEIIVKHYYHLGMAVDTERGLIVPVIRDVDRKSISELSTELQEVVQRVRADEASLQEMQGGTFTITNVGLIGGRHFAPIINFPQVAILGMARAAWRPAVIEEEGQRTVTPRYHLPLILAFDHRVVDGADAARFMRRVVETLEDPNRLMLEV
ncbi:MAG: dihydrolipoamide acetyltransferase family protein [Candidatus Promineifilaceae bacterium]|nr:dihydrolipoamide acetyltransferase family protein [Candidatus Promineifilaceae bacterium]